MMPLYTRTVIANAALVCQYYITQGWAIIDNVVPAIVVRHSTCNARTAAVLARAVVTAELLVFELLVSS